MFDKIVFSDITWSTYLSLMISAFFKIFMAQYLPVFLFLDNLTLPNDPMEMGVSGGGEEEKGTSSKSAEHFVVLELHLL